MRFAHEKVEEKEEEEEEEEEEELVFRGCALISRRPVIQTRACKRKSLRSRVNGEDGYEEGSEINGVPCPYTLSIQVQ